MDIDIDRDILLYELLLDDELEGEIKLEAQDE